MSYEALVEFYHANRSEIDSFFQCRLGELNTLMTICMPVLTELCRLLLEIGVNVLHTLAIPIQVIARFAYDRPILFTGICIAVLLLWQFGGALLAFLQSASAATAASNPEIASALTTDIAIPAFPMAIGAYDEMVRGIFT